MEHLINFLDSMIKQPPAKLNIEGRQDLVLSKNEQLALGRA